MKYVESGREQCKNYAEGRLSASLHSRDVHQIIQINNMLDT